MEILLILRRFCYMTNKFYYEFDLFINEIRQTDAFYHKHVNLVIYQSTNYINAGQTVNNIWLEFVYGIFVGILHFPGPYKSFHLCSNIEGELG